MASTTLENSEHRLKSLMKEAVEETLLLFGIDVSNPESIRAMQQDMHYLRTKREDDARNKHTGKAHLITMFLTALGATIVMGAAQFFNIGR